MISGIEIEYVIVPVAERACRIPTEAFELWITTVIRSPARKPSSGLLKLEKNDWNFAELLSGSNTSSMRVIP